jgi:NAD(P)-dependent dehydrogenase (short-subunit alcohol dehydrogenase family)
MGWSVGAGLEGKGVIVTGAAGGIGKAVAEAFSATGARIMAVDVTQEGVDGVLHGLEGTGHAGMALDLRDGDARTSLIERTQAEFGNLYVLAHLAAVLRRRLSIDEVSEDDWDAQVDVNLKATFFFCRAVANAMKAQGQGGRIIAFTSQAWWTGGFGGGAVYATTKGGLVSMSRNLARTYGPFGITVNTVAPGQVNTPMLTVGNDPALMQALTEATPLKRIAEPEEMAGTVVFLASRHAGFITGATINTTGGLLMY